MLLLPAPEVNRHYPAGSLPPRLAAPSLSLFRAYQCPPCPPHFRMTLACPVRSVDLRPAAFIAPRNFDVSLFCSVTPHLERPHIASRRAARIPARSRTRIPMYPLATPARSSARIPANSVLLRRAPAPVMCPAFPHSCPCNSARPAPPTVGSFFWHIYCMIFAYSWQLSGRFSTGIRWVMPLLPTQILQGIIPGK